MESVAGSTGPPVGAADRRPGIDTTASPRPGAARRARPRPGLGAAARSRGAWIVLALVAAGLLAFGSIHPGATTDAARVAHLETVLKCPSCEDLSIAQSDAPSSLALRARVRRWVADGWSDSRIESAVVASYGESELLVPEPGGVSTTLYVLPVALIVIAAGALSLHLWGRRRKSALS